MEDTDLETETWLGLLGFPPSYNFGAGASEVVLVESAEPQLASDGVTETTGESNASQEGQEKATGDQEGPGESLELEELITVPRSQSAMSQLSKGIAQLSTDNGISSSPADGQLLILQQIHLDLETEETLSHSSTVVTNSVDTVTGPSWDSGPGNVDHVTNYLAKVKQVYTAQPEIYDRFLTILKEYRAYTVDIQGVILRVCSLFQEHPDLIIGFQCFLPVNCKLQGMMDDNNFVLSYEINGEQHLVFNAAQQSQDENSIQRTTEFEINENPGDVDLPVAGAISTLASTNIDTAAANSSQTLYFADAFPTLVTKPVEFKDAVNFVGKIKQRFYDQEQPDKYHMFLDFLSCYQKMQANSNQNLPPSTPLPAVYSKIRNLLKDEQDLLMEFELYYGFAVNIVVTLPKPEEQLEKTNAVVAPSVEEECKLQSVSSVIPPRAATKRGKRASSQAVVKKPKLSSAPRKHKSAPEPVKQGHQMNGKAQSIKPSKNNQKVKVDLSTSKQIGGIGPSYRTIPKGYALPECSGRTALCKEVLNDTFISYKTQFRDFTPVQKNLSEQRAFECEDERFELDVVIEAIAHTIYTFESVARKMAKMTAAEQHEFELDNNLGGDSVTIHQNSVKRLYGQELGPVIIQGLKERPNIAIPLVLQRLRSKAEEWRKVKYQLNDVYPDMYSDP